MGIAPLKPVSNWWDVTLSAPYYNLGRVFQEKGTYDEALTVFRKLSNIEPNRAKIHFRIGQILYTQSLYKEAIEEFKAELKVDPDNEDARKLLNQAESNFALHNAEERKDKNEKTSEPITLADNLNFPYDLVVDRTNVYWVETRIRMPGRGGWIPVGIVRKVSLNGMLV